MTAQRCSHRRAKTIADFDSITLTKTRWCPECGALFAHWRVIGDRRWRSPARARRKNAKT